jgi:hypothetical protein
MLICTHVSVLLETLRCFSLDSSEFGHPAERQTYISPCPTVNKFPGSLGLYLDSGGIGGIEQNTSFLSQECR